MYGLYFNIFIVIVKQISAAVLLSVGEVLLIKNKILPSAVLTGPALNKKQRLFFFLLAD
jgi:hypothetical protein